MSYQKSQLNSVFLLAAGLGTRLKPFTDEMAKPAIPFLGLPQILYPYFFAYDMGIKNIAYNTHHKPETLNKVFKTYNIKATEFHEPKLLDSAGGLGNTLSFFASDDYFMMINADSLFMYNDLKPIHVAFEKHISRKALATLFVVDLPEVGINFPGLWYDRNGLLKGGGLKDKTSLTCHHFIGIYIFSKDIFNYVKATPENILYDKLIPISLEHNNVYVEFLNWPWFELGKIKDYQKNYQSILEECQAERFKNTSSFIRTQKYFNSLWDIKSFKPTDLEERILNF